MANPLQKITVDDLVDKGEIKVTRDKDGARTITGIYASAKAANVLSDANVTVSPLNATTIANAPYDLGNLRFFVNLPEFNTAFGLYMFDGKEPLQPKEKSDKKDPRTL